MESNRCAVEIICFKYLDYLLIKSIFRADWFTCYEQLNTRMGELETNFGIQKKKLTDRMSNKFKYLKSPKLLCSWYLSCGQPYKSLKVADKLTSELQHYSMGITRANNYELKSKSFWLNTLYWIDELCQCIILIERKILDFNLKSQPERAYSNLVKKGSHQPDNVQRNPNNKTPIGNPNPSPLPISLNVYEKLLTMTLQVTSMSLLVAINLGSWNEACLMTEGLNNYLGQIRKNNGLVKFESLLWNDGLRECLVKTSDRLKEFYPDVSIFGVSQNDTKYNTKSAVFQIGRKLKEVFEAPGGGAVKTSSDNLEVLEEGSKIILRTLFRWMFACRFLRDLEKTFAIVPTKSAYFKETSPYVERLHGLMRLYHYELRNDFFKILSVYPLNIQSKISREIERFLMEKTSAAQLASFDWIKPGRDIHLSEIKSNFRLILEPETYVSIIKGITITKLFVWQNGEASQDIEV